MHVIVFIITIMSVAVGTVSMTSAIQVIVGIISFSVIMSVAVGTVSMTSAIQVIVGISSIISMVETMRIGFAMHIVAMERARVYVIFGVIAIMSVTMSSVAVRQAMQSIVYVAVSTVAVIYTMQIIVSVLVGSVAVRQIMNDIIVIMCDAMHSITMRKAMQDIVSVLVGREMRRRSVGSEVCHVKDFLLIIIILTPLYLLYSIDT